ncbi:MAG TPA: alcohol dehydrogenase, partial [Desulfobacterales bacterium]|nr:alcohol dehydrogenase [Desulfobacterales bacterium]
FDVLEEIYPAGVEEFRKMMDRHDINLPKNISKDLSDEQLDLMVTTALNLVPLWENCLGDDWRNIMTRERALDLYKRM